MITLKSTAALLVLALAAPLTATLHAQDHKDHEGMHETKTPAMTEGEVRTIDRDAGKLTLKHGPIKHLDMPGMTMVFQVKDKALLGNFKSGDKVKFMVMREAGKFWITDLQPAR